MQNGDRFGSLVFTGEFKHLNKRKLGVFICDCGKEKVVRIDIVKSGNTKSCGCKSPNKDYKIRRDASGENYGYMVIMSRIQERCKRRNLECTIIWMDIKQKLIEQDNKCAYSGLCIRVPTDFVDLYSDDILSVDRIDSSIGYTPSNIQLVNKKVNLMKLDMSHDDFLTLCSAITYNHNRGPAAVSTDTV